MLYTCCLHHSNKIETWTQVCSSLRIECRVCDPDAREHFWCCAPAEALYILTHSCECWRMYETPTSDPSRQLLPSSTADKAACRSQKLMHTRHGLCMISVPYARVVCWTGLYGQNHQQPDAVTGRMLPHTGRLRVSIFILWHTLLSGST